MPMSGPGAFRNRKEGYGMREEAVLRLSRFAIKKNGALSLAAVLTTLTNLST